MALAPLATVADLTRLGVPTGDAALVESLLESVSAEVRDAAGSPISRVTATITLTGSREQYLPLPVKPVTEVAAVELDGLPVTDWKLVDGRLWRAGGWSFYAPTLINVTLTYGYATVPADIVRLVCMMVAAGVYASEDGFNSSRGLTYESVDDSRVGYATGDAEVVDVAGLPERTRAMLRERFGGGATVTGGY